MKLSTVLKLSLVSAGTTDAFMPFLSGGGGGCFDSTNRRGECDFAMEAAAAADSISSSPTDNHSQKKRVVLIRHGQTYMNELIGGGGTSYGQPGFTDVFDEESEREKYKDSPLSQTGIQQALKLKEELHRMRKAGEDVDWDLHVDEIEKDIAIIALPQASERLYLISDLGRPRSELKRQYSFVDFDSGFENQGDDDDAWHFVPSPEMKENYVEWRPHGQGQVYACLGEHQDAFNRRMSELYYWLEARDEQCIAVVCHAGVIEWMTSGEIFANCELRVKNFEDLRPRALLEIESVRGM
ncbi:MAG: hypothetical protein SGARI_006327 [Bacillariaceae sp.]